MLILSPFKKAPWICFFLITLPFLNACVSCIKENHEPFSGWTHLELGAGNYGLDGHTKKSQKKTVLMKLQHVTSAKNYIDDLPEMDIEKYIPSHQYAVLFWTLDELVKKNGPYGVFHVNDLYAEYAEYATQELRKYAKQKGYDHVVIDSVSCDYENINPNVTLATVGRNKYDSVHLKNTEISFYSFGLDGDQVLCDSLSRFLARSLLIKLANYSNKGLYFFPIDLDNYFIPKEEKEEFINKGIFYNSTKEWPPLAYYFPEGEIIDRQYGKVYFIANESI